MRWRWISILMLVAGAALGYKPSPETMRQDEETIRQLRQRYPSLAEVGVPMGTIEAKVTRDDLIDGLPLRGGTAASFARDQRVLSGTLSRDAEIDGQLCRGGAPFQRASWLMSCTLARAVTKDSPLGPLPCIGEMEMSGARVERCALASDVTVKGLQLRRGTTARFEGDSLRVLVLAADAAFPDGQGLIFKGGSELRFEGASLRPSHGVLGPPQAVGGVVAAAGSEVQFHPSGRVWKLKAGPGAVTIEGIRCKEGDDVHFFADGKLEDAKLVADHVAQRVPCKGDDYIAFHPNGKLHRCALSRELPLRELAPLPPLELPLVGRAGGSISLYPGGAIERIDLPADVDIQGLPSSGDTSFFETGELRETVLAKPTTLAGVPCSSSRAVELHRSGKVKRCTSAEDVKVGGKKIGAGDRVDLDEKQNVVAIER